MTKETLDGGDLMIGNDSTLLKKKKREREREREIFLNKKNTK